MAKRFPSKWTESEKSSCVQMDAGSNIQQRDRSTNTREQRVKIAGVSAGTVARYDTVMSSDNEILKQEVLSGETSINAGYKELTQSKKEERQVSENRNKTKQSNL